jgi:hypothetical protein
MKPVSGIRSFVVRNEAKKAQRLILAGSFLPLAPQSVNPIDHYKLAEAARKIVSAVDACLKKELTLELGGHGLGAAALLLVTALLKTKGYRLSQPVAFALPRMVPASWMEVSKQRESQQERESVREVIMSLASTDAPVWRVVLHDDPAAALFPGCKHAGPEVTLLPGSAFCYASNASPGEKTGPDIEESEDVHKIDLYLRCVTFSVRSSLLITTVAGISKQKFVVSHSR